MAHSKPISDSHHQFFRSSVSKIFQDAIGRSSAAVSRLHKAALGAVLLLPPAVSAGEAGYPSLNSSSPSYDVFQTGTSNDTTVEADVNNFLASSIEYAPWSNRAAAIRASGTRAYCIGNLSVALTEVGAAYAVGSQGASTLLSLLPTAGALIGAPARELWVLYKLMPLAGVLSMVISLGGNIIPMEVNQYEKIDTFEYQGYIATDTRSKERDRHRNSFGPGMGTQMSTTSTTAQEERLNAEAFAELVYKRSRNPVGSRPILAIVAGCLLQCLWLAIILYACYFLSSGAIIVWWCEYREWTYFWWGLVAVSSIIENIAGVPFTHQWSIRVSRAPNVQISEDAPWVISEPLEENPKPEIAPSPTPGLSKSPTAITEIQPVTSSGSSKSQDDDDEKDDGLFRAPNTRLPPEKSAILDDLEKGYDTRGRILIDPHTPWACADDVFYVMLSVRGISHTHALLRIMSKLFSIAVYAVGTALFATTSLVTIMIAVTTAIMVVVSGVFGRVTAMWMASEMMRNAPILHRVVSDREEAAEFVEAILRQKNMICEIMGHVMLNGRCVKRHHRRFRWCHVAGVLANPFNLETIALPSYGSGVSGTPSEKTK